MQPFQCCAQVVAVALEPVGPYVLLDVQDLAVTFLGHGQEELGMAVTKHRELGAFVQSHPGVVADRFEEAVADRVGVRCHDQRRLDQPPEQVHDVLPRHEAPGTDAFGGLQGEATVEDRQSREQDALRATEEVIAPVESRFECLLVRWQVSSRPCEEGELLVEPFDQLANRQHLEPGCGQFDCEGNAVQSPADLGDLLRIGQAKLEVRVDQPCPVDEQLDRVEGCDPVQRPDIGAGDGKGGDLNQVLLPDREPLSGGGQDLQRLRALE